MLIVTHHALHMNKGIRGLEIRVIVRAVYVIFKHSDPNGTYLSENASSEPVRADRNMRIQGAKWGFPGP